MKKKIIIILLGLPGSGKGTQGAIISKGLGLPHISTGDIFRKMISGNSEESKLLASCMSSGKLLSTDLANKIVKKFIHSDECAAGCILDGYPRTIEQAEYLVKNVDAEINTIFFDLEDEIATKRILGRINCASCGKIYNKYFDNPKKEGICDVCGSNEFLSRSDDDEDTILSRIEEYKKETLPMIECIKQNGRFFLINAGELKEHVVNEVSSIIKKI